MESKIFSNWSLPVFCLINLLALFFLFRGHSLPGGGFVAGLTSSISLVLLAIRKGEEPLDFFIEKGLQLGNLGLLLCIFIGVLPTFYGLPFLQHLNFSAPTTFWFDVGIFFVVFSTCFSFFSCFRKITFEHSKEDGKDDF